MSSRMAQGGGRRNSARSRSSGREIPETERRSQRGSRNNVLEKLIGSQTIHMGYTAGTIDAPANIVKAWFMDDYGESGLREELNESEYSKKQIVGRVNDHHFVDYRRTPGMWPLKDRDVVLKHVSADWTKKTFISASVPTVSEEVEEYDQVVRTQYVRRANEATSLLLHRRFAPHRFAQRAVARSYN